MKKLQIFSVPKEFKGHTQVIQSNAIRSWTRLSDEVDVLLIGDDPGVQSFAQANGISHVGPVKRNEMGTPLLDDVFAIAHQHCRAELMMYVNCDIVLTQSLLKFVDEIRRQELDEFLAIGQRVDFDQFEEIDFETKWEEWVEEKAHRVGEYASILCKDYFIFRSSQYKSIPPFSIGRGNWDSWMVSTAAKTRQPIIDATNLIFAGHQNHDYAHVGGRMKAYVAGSEARTNIGLAKGTHYFRGSLATHRISDSGDLVRTNRFPLMTFVRDAPRLMKQLVSFVRPWKAKRSIGVRKPNVHAPQAKSA